MREIGQRHGYSIKETNIAAETDPTLDHEVDDAVQAAGKKQNLVIDSRTAFHWIPWSFKVFLKIDPHVAAQRTFEQIQKEGRRAEHAHSVEEVYENLEVRRESEMKRYKEKYGIDYTIESQFDFVFDTSNSTAIEAANTIVTAYRAWLKN